MVSLRSLSLLTASCTHPILQIVEHSHCVRIPVLLDACKLMQLRMLHARCGHTRLLHTSLLFASPLLYKLLHLIVASVVRGASTELPPEELFSVCWSAISDAFSPWILSKHQAETATNASHKTTESFEDNFPWVVTHKEVGVEILTALHRCSRVV